MDDILLTLAEVAVGFAGFASIASVLSGQRSIVARLRLQMMLLYSFLVLFLSLLPVAATRSGLAPEISWRAACAALAVFTFAILLWPLRRGSAAARASGVPHSRWNGFFLLLQIGPVLLCTVSSLGAFPGRAPAIFVGSLIALLLIAAIVFGRLVLGLVTDSPAA
jgi:hypothetical protein